MLSIRTLFALTFVPAVSFTALSIVTETNNQSRFQRWYLFFEIIFLVGIFISYTLFIHKIITWLQ